MPTIAPVISASISAELRPELCRYLCEHGERVDGITRDRKDAEGTEQNDWDGDHRNDGGAQVLQEDEQHHEDQHDRLEQRVNDLLDRQLDEWRCVVGIGDDHVFRQ